MAIRPATVNSSLMNWYGQGEEEQAEGHHDEPVGGADPALALAGEAGVRAELDDQVLRALPRIARAPGGGLAHRDRLVHPREHLAEQGDAHRGDAERDEDRGDLHEGRSPSVDRSARGAGLRRRPQSTRR
jgi:hypothetical protein